MAPNGRFQGSKRIILDCEGGWQWVDFSLFSRDTDIGVKAGYLENGIRFANPIDVMDAL
jgi:hypothetical protein